MIILPAIDLYEGKAVRLYKGDYAQMTIYSEQPVLLAQAFASQGASQIHLVDLEGARSGQTPNIAVIRSIIQQTGLQAEVGGGIRSMAVIKDLIDCGANRVILGTAAVKDEAFLRCAVKEYGKRIAVGVDIRDGFVSVNGWLEQTQLDCFSFCEHLQEIGVETLICTDISRDGAMRGANHDLYKKLNERCNMHIIASGGVSSMEDVARLKELGVYGAIVGKAYYTGAIELARAIELAQASEVER